ncbi:hypothetical protein Pfo_013481 [Paulownia fortunei]|nr:hypothetical protein Pfo_013481 [Paulownia fortunei]
MTSYERLVQAKKMPENEVIKHRGQKMPENEVIMHKGQKMPENEVIKHKGLRNGDEKVLDQSQIRSSSDEKHNNYFMINNNVFEPNLILSDLDLDEKSDDDFTSDEKFKLDPTYFNTLVSSSNLSLYDNNFTSGKKFELCPTSSNTFSNLSLSLSDESMSDDAEEDYLIEIPLPEQAVGMEERKRHKLETELLDLLPESVLQQEGLEDFLSDINEICGEDNLIEIDISMGSIRQSESGCEIRT